MQLPVILLDHVIFSDSALLTVQYHFSVVYHGMVLSYA